VAQDDERRLIAAADVPALQDVVPGAVPGEVHRIHVVVGRVDHLQAVGGVDDIGEHAGADQQQQQQHGQEHRHQQPDDQERGVIAVLELAVESAHIPCLIIKFGNLR